ncbi:MAG: hypothetical protein QW310_03775, partial [Thermoproteota archaeon]
VSFKAIPNSISYVLLTINKLTACEGVSIYSYYKHFSRMCKKFNKVEKYSTSFYILLVLVGFLIYLSVMLVIAIK